MGRFLDKLKPQPPVALEAMEIVSGSSGALPSKRTESRLQVLLD
jgi:hypothetical protein